MKVYIVTKEAFPYGGAVTNRILNYARGLIANGQECEVITFRRSERKGCPSYNKERIGVYDGVNFKYLPPTIYYSRNKIIQRCEDISDCFRLLYFCLNINKNDKVLLYLTDLFFYPFVLLPIKCRKVKIARELSEYPYAVTEESLKTKVFSFISLKLFKLFDGLVVISHELERVAMEHKRENALIVRIPILVKVGVADEGKYEHHKPYIFHGGSMFERKDAIVSTMKAFAMASKRLNYSIDYILAGPKSPHQKELEEIIQKNNLGNNVTFMPKQKRETITKLQNGASLCVLNKNDNIQNRCGFSTKLGEILLSETAVVTTTVGEANYYLKDGVSAYITEPHHPEMIADKIVEAFSDKEKRERVAQNGKKIAEEYFDILDNGKILKKFFITL